MDIPSPSLDAATSTLEAGDAPPRERLGAVIVPTPLPAKRNQRPAHLGGRAQEGRDGRTGRHRAATATDRPCGSPTAVYFVTTPTAGMDARSTGEESVGIAAGLPTLFMIGATKRASADSGRWPRSPFNRERATGTVVATMVSEPHDVAGASDRSRVLGHGHLLDAISACEPVPTFQVPAIDADDVGTDPPEPCDVSWRTRTARVGWRRALNEMDVHIGAASGRENDDDLPPRHTRSLCVSDSPLAGVMTGRGSVRRDHGTVTSG